MGVKVLLLAVERN